MMKREQWEAVKDLKPIGGVRVPISTRAAANKKPRTCGCGHGPKHHAAHGRCKRGSCLCGLARHVFGSR